MRAVSLNDFDSMELLEFTCFHRNFFEINVFSKENSNEDFENYLLIFEINHFQNKGIQYFQNIFDFLKKIIIRNS